MALTYIPNIYLPGLTLSSYFGTAIGLLKLGTHLKMFSVFIKTIIMLTFPLSLLLDHQLFTRGPGNFFLISFLGLGRK